MATIPSEMYAVHEVLRRYVAVHDDIFKFAWRKLLPVPGLFRPIQFGAHSSELSALVVELQKASVPLRRDVRHPQVFVAFVAALLETVIALREICKKLDPESQGDVGGYRFGAYSSDVASYNRPVDQYRALGAEINQHL